MSADIYTTATQLAILQAGRTPVWSTQPDALSSAPPASAAAGVALQKAVRTLVHVSLRENARFRTARLTIPTLDNSVTYTVAIDGNAVNTVVASALTRAQVVTAIAASITAAGTVNTIVTATTEDADDDGAVDTVLIQGIGEEDFSIAFTQSDAAVVACEADPCTATARLWWVPDARVGSTPPLVWAWSAEPIALDRRGLLERLDSAGLARLFVQVSDRRGHWSDGADTTLTSPVISIGPCLSEVA